MKTFVLWFQFLFVLIDNNAFLVYVMTRQFKDVEPLPEPIMVTSTDSYMPYLATVI